MPFIIDSRRGGRVLAVVAAAASLVALPATAAADEPVTCSAPVFSNPFAPWGDDANYVLAPGGDMESSLEGWTLSGGAAPVAGSEPFNVTAATDATSLSLPTGSSAVSTPVCVDITYPKYRFFARNAGAKKSRLNVEVLYTDAAGVEQSLTRGVVYSDGTWAPTRRMILGAPVVTRGISGLTPVRFRFTPSAEGAWQIDDLYVDPYARG